MNAADLGFQLHGTALRLTTRAPDAPGPGPLASSPSSRAVGARQAYYVPAGSYPKDVAAAASFPCKGFGPPPGPPRPAPARAPALRSQPSMRPSHAAAGARPRTARPRTAATTAASHRYLPRDDSAAVPARPHPSNGNPPGGPSPAAVPTAWGSSPRLAEATVPSGEAGPLAAPTPPTSRLSESMTRLVLEDASPSPSPLPPELLDFRGMPAPSPPAIASNPAALSSLPTPPLSPQPTDFVHASSSSLHQELRPEPDGDASRRRRPISSRTPPARTKTASTSTSSALSTRPPPSRYYDHKSVKRQTSRKNTEQWAMETIVIRRLRYLVDHLDELGEEHLPLLNTLEASGIRPDQLQLYFPHVRTVHDLKVHLVNLLSDRDPDHVRPHRAVARNLASTDRPPGPPPPPPVGVTAGPSRRSHGQTKPASTPLEVLKIVEQFYPIPPSAAAATGKSVPGSDARLGLATATTTGASVGGLGAAAATAAGGLGGAAATRHRLAG
ncbi:hypothetical protein AMAG_11039 [Allomyces macrogynus ATCC 38327]|uniref:Uncharacterized protein n=1 Tax=Allomyces macrogynus (strain ATCC 38327) TaxID=578462 RepID=A0A0L0SS77_ALLM3|nr:hypothetical protein AMAG_11039 [Allomyces macrogynus ATCC 38327]|eukprot:KNE65408.1 hypothetical protein AMAG_11039 [Allomyces macrogynus ATCC 38327]